MYGLDPQYYCSHCGRYLLIGKYSGLSICLNCDGLIFSEEEKEKYFMEEN